MRDERRSLVAPFDLERRDLLSVASRSVDLPDHRALDDPRAARPRRVEKDRVERDPAHTERLDRQLELERRRARRGQAQATDARRLEGEKHPERADLIDAHDRLARKELAAELVARKAITIEEHGVEPAAREERRRDASRRAASHDGDVALPELPSSLKHLEPPRSARRPARRQGSTLRRARR